MLATSHGALYLNLVYGSDFGPTPPGKSQRTDGLALIREANERGISVKAWLTTPFAQGTFANENNAAIMADAVPALVDWVVQNEVLVDEIVLDLEFPLGYQAIADALGGDLSGVLALARANIDPEHQCDAIVTYRDAISWAHEHGWRITGAPVPFALDDLADGHLALQDALDITAFPPLGYDMLYLQAYRTYSNTGPGYVARYYADMQSHFGAAGQITLGDTNMGTPPYNNLDDLVRDVRMLAGLGATTIPIFDLDGSVRGFGAEGLREIIDAGMQPLTGDELAAASKDDVYSDLHRVFFQSLDSIATALTTVVTAGGQPNAYPDGCGDPYADPLG